jgi:hypothetical protein
LFIVTFDESECAAVDDIASFMRFFFLFVDIFLCCSAREGCRAPATKRYCSLEKEDVGHVTRDRGRVNAAYTCDNIDDDDDNE